MSDLKKDLINDEFINENFFRNKELNGRLKRINVEVAFDNLVLLSRFFNDKKILFLPAFGTLLGLFRDKNLIYYDIDVDLIIDESYKEEFFATLSELEDFGFKMVRSIFKGNLITIAKNNEHIDLYFFSKLVYKNKTRYILTGSKYKFDYKFFEQTIVISVRNQLFNVPLRSEMLLRRLYGKKWITPMTNKNYYPDPVITGLKKVYSKLPKFLKTLYKFLKS